MDVKIEVNNKTDFKFSKEILKEIARSTILKSRFAEKFANKSIEISVAFVRQEEIHSINNAYRKKDKPTDVLSFEDEEIENIKADEIFLGEIILCPEYISRLSSEEGRDFGKEMVYVFSHGILHLLKYDHDQEMFKIQEEIMDEIKLV